MVVTPLYAGVLALMFVFLSARVIRRRRDARVGLGDGGDKLLLRRVRVHGNFAEYAPFTLLLMALCELQGAPAASIHVIGLMCIAGRICHALGVGHEPERSNLRVVGMVLTFFALVSGGLMAIGPALPAMFGSGSAG